MSFPRKEIGYIKNQLEIIQNKTSVQDLNTYRSSLYYAKKDDAIKEPLFAACNQREIELDRSSAVCVQTDMSDMGGQFDAE